MKPTFTYVLLLCALFCSKVYSQTPNVIVIIADDMGWSQVSTGLTNLNNQSDFYETPNLETLASQGIAFPHGYVNGANCAPTRAALLSGQYAARPTNNIFAVDHLNRASGITPILDGPANGLPNGIDELPNDPGTNDAITLAETMQTAGYATVHLGKYHVGENESTNVSNNDATDQGFDRNYGGGTKGNPGSYFASGSPGNYTFHNSIGPELDVYADPYTLAESMELAGDNSLEGTPKHVTDAMYDAAEHFMDSINVEVEPFFMHFSNFAIHGPLGQSNSRPDLWAKYNTKSPSSSMGHTNIAIGAIAEAMDQTIGRLIDYLKTTSDPRNPGKMLSENTLVYFISDNGGAINTQENGPLRGMKGDLYEGGIRSISIVWSEAPWLQNKGTVNNTPIIGFDIYPTFVEAAGGTLPSGYDIDGVSHWDMLTNGTALSRDAIYWHFPGYIRQQTPVTVIRKGDFKLIHFYETASYEMYDLINDMSESNNLLAGNPDQTTIDFANTLVADMITHLTDTSAPLPTYKTGPDAGNEVPLPALITNIPQNSTDGCQAESGYDAYWDFDTATSTDDASGNGNNAVSGVPTYDGLDFVEGDQSVVFDGSTEVQYSNGAFLTDATAARSVSVWIKPTALIGTQEIFEEGGSGNGLALRLNGSNIEARITNNTDPDENVSAVYPSDGNWHHVVLIFDGANTTLAIYIDGVLANSNTSAFNTLNSHTSPGGIGGVITGDAYGSGTNDSYFTGKMDAFSVYNSVLSLIQIQDAACLVIPNSTDGLQAASGYEAYWDFDIASDANDASGNSHDPQVATSIGITYDTGDFKEGDQSVVFDGSEAIQYATNSNSPDTFLNTATSTRSIMTWIKPTGLSGNQNIFDEGGNNKGIAVRLSGNKLESVIRDTNTTASTIDATFPNDGGWHHVAMVYDGGSTSHKIYIDGVEVGSDSGAPGNVPSNLSYGGIAGKLSGKDSFQNTLDAFFTGKMDAFAVYNSVKTLGEIQVAAGITLGIDDKENDFGLIYPNPFNNEINVKFRQISNYITVELFDILGKEIISKKFKNTSFINFPVEDLSSGLYLLKINSDDNVLTKKIIKR